MTGKAKAKRASTKRVRRQFKASNATRDTMRATRRCYGFGVSR